MEQEAEHILPRTTNILDAWGEETARGGEPRAVVVAGRRRSPSVGQVLRQAPLLVSAGPGDRAEVRDRSVRTVGLVVREGPGVVWAIVQVIVVLHGDRHGPAAVMVVATTEGRLGSRP